MKEKAVQRLASRIDCECKVFPVIYFLMKLLVRKPQKSTKVKYIESFFLI